MTVGSGRFHIGQQATSPLPPVPNRKSTPTTRDTVCNSLANTRRAKVFPGLGGQLCVEGEHQHPVDAFGRSQFGSSLQTGQGSSFSPLAGDPGRVRVEGDQDDR